MSEYIEPTLHVNLVETSTIKFCGTHGRHEYVEGRSVNKLQLREAMRIGATLEATDDDGVQLTGSNFELLAEKHTSAPVVEVKVELPSQPKFEPQPEPELLVMKTAYTREQLESIADKRGLAGLREISDPLNLKGRSIPDLVKEILAEQTRARY